MDTSQEGDIQAATPGVLSRAAGLSSGIAGVFAVLLGVQSWANLRMSGLWLVAPPLFILLGAAGVFGGWKISRARGWAAIVNTAQSSLLSISVLLFTLVRIFRGYFSLLAPMVLVLSLVATILSAISIPHGLRADAARSRLAAQGLDLGT